ncbi:hypothetical protein ACLB1N_26480 [Escherichia coli]
MTATYVLTLVHTRWREHVGLQFLQQALIARLTPGIFTTLSIVSETHSIMRASGYVDQVTACRSFHIGGQHTFQAVECVNGIRRMAVAILAGCVAPASLKSKINRSATAAKPFQSAQGRRRKRTFHVRPWHHGWLGFVASGIHVHHEARRRDQSIPT